jgi:hypothetical protein
MVELSWQEKKNSLASLSENILSKYFLKEKNQKKRRVKNE